MTDAMGIDASLLERHATWPRWSIALACIVVALAATEWPPVARELAWSSPLPTILFAMWPPALAVLFALGLRMYVEPRFRVLRIAFDLYAPTVLAASGACSTHDASPAYALLLLAPPCWGHLFTGNRTMAASIALSPLVLRVLAVPDPTPASLAIAAAFGPLVALAFLLFSARRLAHRRSEARQLTAETRGASDIERVADRWTASRLHDRLSGVLMLAQAHGEAADAGLARTVVAQARAALDDPTAHPDDHAEPVAGSLRALACSLGVPLDVSVHGAARPSPAFGELRELLGEMIANQARHAAGRPMRIALSVRGATVHAFVEGGGDGRGQEEPTSASASGGRGRRNLALRVAALDGRVTWRRRARGWAVELGLPLAQGQLAVQPALWALELGAHFVVLALLCRASLAIALAFGTVTLGLAALNIVDMHREHQRHLAMLSTLRSTIRGALPRALAQARATLGPRVSELERAAERSADARRDAIEALATRTSELLTMLEDGMRPPAT